jgi:putative transposase
MNNNRKTNNRRSTRLKNYDYSQPGFYFITICTHEKKWLFGNVIDDQMHLNNVGNIVHTVWNTLPERFPNIKLDEYIIRRDSDLDQIRQYITTNPASWSNDVLNNKEGIAL